MATLKIGDKTVTVDDAFLKLSPEQQNATVEEIAAKIGAKGATATPPPNFKPGSREYADWAATQARAGRALPQVSPTPPAAGQVPMTGPLDKIQAAYTGAVNAVPIAGPAMMGGLNSAKGALYGVPAEQIAAENASREQQNPNATLAGQVAGTVVPFMAAGPVPYLGRALGMTGGLASRVGFGAASGMGIGAADTAARGGNTKDMTQSALVGAGLGGALPVVGRGVGAVVNKALGRGVSAEMKPLARALKDDSIAAGDVNAKLGELGDGSMVMDLGPNLQRQAGALASVPGPAQKTIRSAVENRRGWAPARVENDVAKTMGTGPGFSAMQDQIIAGQKAAADPLYKAVRDVKVPVQQGNFAFVFQTPMGKAALAKARQMAANDGYRGTDTIGIIDYAKRALDDIASKAGRTGAKNEARQARDLARVLTAEADKLVPGYKAARDAYAGPAKVLDALDAGSAVFGKEMSPTQLSDALKSMSTSERDAFLQGARATIEAQMGNAVNEALALRNLFKKGYNEQKLRLILGPKVADDLMKRINREAVYGKTENVVTGNSETAAREAAQGEVDPLLRRTERPQGLTGMVFQAFDWARAGLRGKTQPKVNAKLGDLLSSGILSAEQIAALTRAGQPAAPAMIGPATGGLLTGPNKPLEITIGGMGGGR